MSPSPNSVTSQYGIEKHLTGRHCYVLVWRGCDHTLKGLFHELTNNANERNQMANKWAPTKTKDQRGHINWSADLCCMSVH